ncbi:MAG: hypothetical protein K2G89_04460 [Lachnospiraceae bacterium]|nr:hypothetical protein [Lachnospiraceae bacterium]
MRMKTKKVICILSLALFVTVMSVTVQAARYATVESGTNDAKVFGNINMNSAAYSYAGRLAGSLSDTATGTFKVTYKKDEETVKVFAKDLSYNDKMVDTTTKKTNKYIKQGLTLTVSCSTGNKKSVTIAY